MKSSITLFILVVCLIVHSVRATEIPAGPVSGHWYSSGNPYNINGEIYVPADSTLNIHEGVEVIFQGHHKFIVNGWLYAMGTENDSILITAENTSEGWNAFRFIDAPDSSYFVYCTLEYGNNVYGSILETGGAISCNNSNLAVINCTFQHNFAFIGGGIGCWNAGSYVKGCVFCDNRAEGTYSSSGGGIYAHSSTLAVEKSAFYDNSCWWQGGAICFENSGAAISNCTFYRNAGSPGGAVYSYGSNATVINCILWNNYNDQISAVYGTNLVNYCGIMGGWPGTGNINLYPEFVDTTWSDYRLQWGSPCIDAGDPDPIYNDPDGTRADMGAYYYDQSIPVRILLTPHDTPIQIPATGGSFDYTIRATSIAPTPLDVNVWCDATLPDGTVIGPVLGPVSATLDSGITVSRERTQVVPAGAPTGIYSYNAYAVAGVDTSTDSFTFIKLGSDGENALSGWFNTGESFEGLGDSPIAPTTVPETYSLHQNYPNPFNPITTISFSLPNASWVSLEILSINGRHVATLVGGWRNVGAHQVTLDGSNLASGIYIYRIEAGDFTTVKKMILMK